MWGARSIGLVPKALPRGRVVAVSSLLDETLQHLLPPGLFEINRQLVAFDVGDGAVAEFEVKHPLAHAKSRAVIAEIDRAGDEIAVDGQRAAALAICLLGAGAL